MNFDDINEHYKSNPPSNVLDSEGVRHIVEVDLPAEYELNACSCGIKHPLESDTWYHYAMPMTKTLIDRPSFKPMYSVFRACKTCREVLTKRLK